MFSYLYIKLVVGYLRQHWLNIQREHESPYGGGGGDCQGCQEIVTEKGHNLS